MELLPGARGTLSGHLLAGLVEPPGTPLGEPDLAAVVDPVGDDDLQLALFLAYALHYRGLPGIDERWEWDPGLLAWRAVLEASFEDALREAVTAPEPPPDPREMDVALRAVDDAADGPSLSRHLDREGTLEEFREFAMHRSAYQLMEADPHSWALPRLSGAPKAALVEIQVDEYGGGRPDRIHAELFRQALVALDLDPRDGAYVDVLPGVTLATVNLMSLCGLHRRLRGAIVGHLALFEMTSSVPNRRYANALRRLGLGEPATAFFDEHVTADAVHESIAAVDLAGGLARAEPALAGDILWGAAALAALEARWSAHLLGAWDRGVSSLLEPARAQELAG